jgi:hypothetical protein
MTAVFTTDQLYSPRLRAALPHATLAPSWESFCHACAAAECGVVLLPWDGRDATLEPLRQHASRFPQLALILITHNDAENARFIRNTPLADLLWIDEIEERLLSATMKAAQSRMVLRTANALTHATTIPAGIRSALAAALRGEYPLRSINDLASFCGRDRRTLWYHWHQLPTSEEIPLKDMIRWIILIRAATLKLPSRKWAAIADELGIDTRSLGRWANRLTGLRLRDLAGTGIPTLLQHFRQRALSHLLTYEALDDVA